MSALLFDLSRTVLGSSRRRTTFRRFYLVTLPLAALLVALGLAAPAVAQTTATAAAPEATTELATSEEPTIEAQPVTLNLIMGDPDWLGRPPEEAYWSDDGRSVYYFQKREGEDGRDLFQVDLNGETRLVPLAERGTAGADGGAWSSDRTLRIYERAGDLYLKKAFSGEIVQLTRTSARESAPRFQAGDTAVAFRRDGQIFVRDLITGLEEQPAELLFEDDPAADDEKEKTFLEAQQQRLFDVIREADEKARAAREREERARREDPSRVAPAWYLGKDREPRQAQLSPSGRWMIIAIGAKDEDRGKADSMPNYVTASGYVETRTVRPKVGTGTPATESLVLLDLETGARHDLDLTPLPTLDEDPLAWLQEDSDGTRRSRASIEEEDLEPEVIEIQEGENGNGDDGSSDGTRDGAPDGARAHPGPQEQTTARTGSAKAAGEEGSKLRPVYFGQMRWNESGDRLAVVAYSADNKDRWILAIDPERADVRVLHHLRDEAWINWRYNQIGWLADGRTLFYLSEETGYSHLYLVDGDGGEARALTWGSHEISDVQPSWRGDRIYFRSSQKHPGVTEIYRVDVATGIVEQLTDLGGLSSAELSPDESLLLIEASFPTRPTELYLQPTEPGAPATPLTQTVSPEFAAIDWVRPEVVEIPSSHGAGGPIYSRLYLPPADAPGDPRERPAVLFVHGAGYLQNAHKGWSVYFREFMFHTLLARAGYVVLDMDYRASAGYGRDWRTAIYRQMGTPEVEDLRDGVTWLVNNHGVDPARVGVYGGSYGGFLTMMALFTDPELFAAGAALRPVTDWAHYNHPYTSNILNTPDTDPEAYSKSSPIEFADGLEKPLLICAPMQDDNVFFQDTVRLAQRLIELEKDDWEVALYPIEPHGFREPSSWLDEYKRIFKLFERYLKADR